jgi:ribosome biogenesis protein Tsr3
MFTGRKFRRRQLMSMAEALTTVRYITDAQGETTDVIVPIETWKAFLQTWRELVEQLEDQEDRTIVQEWLEKRARGEVHTTALADLEQELRADGLLSS